MQQESIDRGEAIQFALRRSKHRVTILRSLGVLLFAYAAQLSAHGGVSLGYTLDALGGRHPAYRAKYSLVALGLARRVVTPLGTAFEMTDEGIDALAMLDAAERASGLRPY